MLYFTKSTEDANFKYLTDNKTEVLKFIPENVLNDFEKQMKLTTVFTKAIDEKSQKIDEPFLTSELVKILGDKEGKVLSSKIRLDYYFSNKNYNDYQKAAIEYYQDTAPYDAVELNLSLIHI